METGLVRYESARRALAEVKDIDEIRDIRDKAEAMRMYARQRDDVDMEAWVAAIKIRACRRIGELSKELEPSPRSKGGSRHPDSGMPTKTETLKSVGISTSAANRYEKLAEIPESEFDAIVETARAEHRPVTFESVMASTVTTRKRKENSERRAEIAKLDPSSPDKLYNAIVIDPPWPMEKIEREVAPNQTGFDYPTMSETELAALEIPADKDCHLWLWTTHKFMPMAFRLLESWKFKYVCTFVWHKPGGFQPFGLPQYNSEFALYARRGSPTFVETKAFFTCFEAPRGEHSEKPESFYDVLRRVTEAPRIDMFNRRPIHGFDVWGNEAKPAT